jgi:hypothetical protein
MKTFTLLIAIGLSAFAAFGQGWSPSSGGVMTTTDSVNVGSTAAPEAKLDVTAANPWLDGFANNLRLVGPSPSLRFYDSARAKSALIGYGSGYLWFGVGYGTTGNYMLGLREGAAIFNGGNVGVGTTTPSGRLHVVDNRPTPNAMVLYAQKSGAGAYSYGVNAQAIHNTTEPTTWHIAGYFTTYRNGAAGAGQVAGNYGVYVDTSIDATNGIAAANNYGLYISDQNNANATNNYALFYNFATAPFVLKANGNLGIGKSDPNVKLDVVGDAHFTGTVSGGNIQANYQDVAEWVPASEAMAPGTVVTLNAGRRNEVMPSAHPYDTSVAGVVSSKPGILLGEGSEGKAKIATTGRVRVRVDATLAAIRIGDLLVTSDRSGVAMKSEPLELNGRRFHQPGTILGKALEPLDRGEGEILVLLTLQ